jgi:hypothetical protein
MKPGVKMEVEKEPFEKFESREQDGNSDHPFVKSESTEIKNEVKTEVKVEPFEKFESREQDGIDLITSENFDHSLVKSEIQSTEMKTEVKNEVKTEIKNEVKEEPFQDFESREQMGIDLITSKYFDQKHG